MRKCICAFDFFTNNNAAKFMNIYVNVLIDVTSCESIIRTQKHTTLVMLKRNNHGFSHLHLYQQVN